MTRQKDFFEGRLKIEKGTFSEGVTKKDTRTRFGDRVCGKNRGATRENTKNRRDRVWTGHELL